MSERNTRAHATECSGQTHGGVSVRKVQCHHCFETRRVAEIIREPDVRELQPSLGRVGRSGPTVGGLEKAWSVYTHSPTLTHTHDARPRPALVFALGLKRKSCDDANAPRRSTHPSRQFDHESLRALNTFSLIQMTFYPNSLRKTNIRNGNFHGGERGMTSVPHFG